MIFNGVEICCPHCRGDLRETGDPPTELGCEACGRSFPVICGIPDLRVFPDPYIDMEADRAKGMRVAARLDELSFAELVEYYYSITSVVPPQHARQYTRGLLAAQARAQATLASWAGAAGARSGGLGNVLEIGCGTGPLLVAAAPHAARVAGVDIAFRWLVVARKRLAEAGVDATLICACAEALPFPDDSFDRVLAESAIEHVADQRQALAECYRVTRAGGSVGMSTPNRLSLGPDPQAGVWAGGMLPERWIAAYVRAQGGIPPRRRLLAAGALQRLVEASGFERVKVFLPDIPEGQRRHFSGITGLLMDVYRVARTLPVARAALRWVGPMLLAVAEKPVLPARPEPLASQAASAV
jgi:2-polyprenyl-3-methyl-5-hydroxy-6-metoxy-1,4-benzoquinol methylase/uncharacterized protein YbaR (Trm112 family)